jgi:hypothetical protein
MDWIFNYIKQIGRILTKYNLNPKIEIERLCYNLVGLMNHCFHKNELIENINAFEFKKYSQNFEDGIIELIFHKIGTTNKFFVEFGVEDGSECLTKNLIVNHSWNGLQMDGTNYGNSYIKNEFITAENINELFVKYKVPFEFDLLVIDIDGNDYWVWEKLVDYSPRVVVMEYNAKFPPPQSVSISYNSNHVWDRTDYMGASLSALNKLGKSKGYTLVGCDRKGINAFFVLNELVENNFRVKPESELYRPPQYGKYIDGKRIGHPASKSVMVEI